MASTPIRSRKTRLLAGALAIGALAWTPSAAADDTRPAPKDWSETELGRMIERELERAFDQMERALEDLPRYGLPEVTEEGDIVIPRLPRRRESWPPVEDDPDEIIDL